MDSGWNDPPKVETISGPLKINLNKRIAFPMQQQTSSTQIGTKNDHIPCATPPKSLIVNQDNKKDETLQNDNRDMSTEKTRIMESLKMNVQNLELNKQNDVLKKLQLLDNDWKDIDSAALKFLFQLEKCKSTLKIIIACLFQLPYCFSTNRAK